MIKYVTVAFSVVVLLSLVLTGCSEPVSASAAPEQVVEAFYRWFLGYPGNPLVDRAYRDSEYLAPLFVTEVDELLDSLNKGAFDPFLLAQDIPAEITVERATVEGDLATVLAQQRYAGNPLLRPIRVHLRLIDGAWKISRVSDPVLEMAGRSTPSALDPVGVVVEFYNWYLDMIETPDPDRPGNPLVERAYHSTDLLTSRFVHKLDAELDSGQPPSHDPFLCAQDIPRGISTGDVTVMGDTAVVEVFTSFARHDFRVNLTAAGGRWQIDNVRCGGH